MLFKLLYTIANLTPTTTITPARQAMLELSKSKQQARSNSSSRSNSNDSDYTNKKKNKKPKPNKSYKSDLKKELGKFRKEAYIVKFGKKMI